MLARQLHSAAANTATIATTPISMRVGATVKRERGSDVGHGRRRAARRP